MFSNIGVPGLILIILFALIVFGPKKLPELGRSMGKTLKEFKSATHGLTGDDEVPSTGTVSAVAASTEAAPQASAGTGSSSMDMASPTPASVQTGAAATGSTAEVHPTDLSAQSTADRVTVG